MSTRCNIDIYDGDGDEPGAILYHHCDGYPKYMIPYLNDILKSAFKRLKDAGYPYWWDSERVAAVLIAQSAYEDEVDVKEIPVLHPCLQHHGDIEYVYKVRLYNEGEWTIEHSGDDDD